MRASVVICTLGRPQGVHRALDALRLQRHRDFEVIVVEGPGEPAGVPPEARHERCPEANTPRARNIGIAAAAGEVVAFLDDDAVCEPTWLGDLLAPYEDRGVAGTGGLVLDGSGWRVQYRAAVCDRLGRPQLDRRPPLVREAEPGADPFLYFQGTNMSFRRDALLDVAGFDEQMLVVFDDVEVCVRLIDAGHRLLALEGAPVHHHQAASAVRDQRGALRDPLLLVRSHAYFAVCHRGGRSVEEVRAVVAEDAEGLRMAIRSARSEGSIDATRCDELLARIELGIAQGSDLALAQPRSGVALPPAPVDSFRPYLPVRSRPARRLCVIEDGAAARTLAGEGDDVHLLACGGDSPRVALRDGVWQHRLGRGSADRCRAARYHEVLRVDRLSPVDLVIDEGAPAGTPAKTWTARVASALPAGLLDASAYPLDFVSSVLGVWDQPPQDFLSAVYELALGRESDALGRARWLPALERDDSRLAVVAEILASEEARARDVPALWAERLTAHLIRDAAPRLRDAWLSDDEAFVHTAFRVILQRRADPAGTARLLDHLRAGGSRFEVVDELCASSEARARGMPAGLGQTVRDEVFGAFPGWIADSRDAGDDRFMRVLWLASLGREPDAVWAAARRGELEGELTRADIVRELAVSDEARRHGLAEAAVPGLLEAVGGQAEEPGEPGSPLPESAAGGAGDMAPNPDRSAST